MGDLLFFFLENMALIIALMYLAIKSKEAVLLDWSGLIHLNSVSSFRHFSAF